MTVPGPRGMYDLFFLARFYDMHKSDGKFHGAYDYANKMHSHCVVCERYI